MTAQAELIRKLSESEFKEITPETESIVVINTSFDISKKQSFVDLSNYQLTDETEDLLKNAISKLNSSGLLFVYGLPLELPYIGEYLRNLSDGKQSIIFKYWITLAVDQKTAENIFNTESMGMLMYLKSKPKHQSSFHLNTKTVRIPYFYCTACGENVKDWGGKKHLMNPLGTGLSDVWRDFPKTQLINDAIPESVLNRVYELTVKDEKPLIYVKATHPTLTTGKNNSVSYLEHKETQEWQNLKEIKTNEVYNGDAISFLNRTAELYPEGLFDLAFADPPYNLQKEYSTYDDALNDRHYIDWCNEWLDGMVRSLKPGGSLFVLNLPKWCIEHAVFLNGKMEFRNWITWDALSDPKGKIMPAHYALLYYTKPGGNNTLNKQKELWEVTSPQYCLRQGCTKKRKAAGDDVKIQLTDIWSGVHRIKHKRDRDAHPCQLPEKLLERIISLTTNEGDLVFDPFGGSGTTAVAAKKLNRNYIITELDTEYAEIARKNLAGMDKSFNLFGELVVPRESIKRPNKKYTKKSVEKTLQDLAINLRRTPTVQDIEASNPDLINQIKALYPAISDALKSCRIVLRQSA